MVETISIVQNALTVAYILSCLMRFVQPHFFIVFRVVRSLAICAVDAVNGGNLFGIFSFVGFDYSALCRAHASDGHWQNRVNKNQAAMLSDCL